MRKGTGGGRGAGTPVLTPAGRQQEHRRVWQHRLLQFPPGSTGAEPTGVTCRCQGGSWHCPSLEGGGARGEWGGQGPA